MKYCKNKKARVYTLFTLFSVLIITNVQVRASQPIPAPWFESFKQQATPEQLYNFLYLLPKGGDLHNHLNGANFSEWWFELATNQQLNGGYRYYTQLYANLCQSDNAAEFASIGSFLAFRNIQHSHYEQLSACEKSQYKLINDLTPPEKQGWFNSIRLDKTGEGRNEFFEKHWSRLNDLMSNPYIQAGVLVKNMQAFGQENVVYLETQVGARNMLRIDGSYFTPEQVVDIYQQRLTQKDALSSGVTTRLQYTLLRFAPDAEQQLEWMYRFVDRHRDLYVGINMAGREDNDKGYPLRFLPTLRKLRSTLPAVDLSIHAGEVDEPNFHVRDTLLLGATRIGHGVNLIDDPQTMVMMRNGQALVEINLVSNLLLEYISDYSQHPFPEYLRTGIPVALSTDDRGMWDSTMTDEYFVAVKEFNLSWQELITLGQNSLKYSFVDEQTKKRLLSQYDARIEKFVKDFKRQGMALLKNTKSEKRAFICKQYQLCHN
jgi:adenosine deaminase CECR1